MKEISQMNTLELLRFVLDDSQGDVERKSPSLSVPPESFPVAVVTNPITLRIFSVGAPMKSGILLSLFWQAVVEENPSLALRPNRSICQTWVVASPDRILAPGPEHTVAFEVVSRLTDIVGGDNPPFSEPPLIEVRKGEREIGVLKDPRVRALYALCYELVCVAQHLDQDAAPDSREGILFKYYKGLIHLLEQLIFRAVRDVFSEVGRTFSVRKGWKVVVPRLLLTVENVRSLAE